MKFLVGGLGSMGKRRIRCLKALGCERISGFDPRADRRQEAETKYGIRTYSNFKSALGEEQPDALIISVPPDYHHIYMKEAIRNKLHFFVEASVTDTYLDEIIKKARITDIVAAPSATLLFHPAIRKIDEVIKSGDLGKISNVIYHSGQYLTDWHPYESVSDFYVSNLHTGGCREIVPFELTWLLKIFGFPKGVIGNVRKTINIPGAESIDDTYNILLDYGDFLAALTVDVVSRYATRRLLINGDRKQLTWSWDNAAIRLYDPEKKCWEEINYEMDESAPGYNQNIGENMYIDEIRNFLDAVNGERPFINSLENDHKILGVLYEIEASDSSAMISRSKKA